MIRKLMKTRVVYLLLRSFFSLFYKKDYLKGFYFEEKAMGWVWAWRGLRGRLWGENKNVPWPVHPRTIVNILNGHIEFDPKSLNVFQTPGCYWQAREADIYIGKNCHVAPNVGVITTNHDLYNPAKHVEGKNVYINDNCWIGMNAVILPGVYLGPNTVVAAGAVVTKSFQEGHCVVAGVPAKCIKNL